MSGNPNEQPHFNYTRTGIITGLVLGSVTTLMGIYFIADNVARKEYTRIFLSAIIVVMGVGCIGMEIYRSRRMKKKGN